MRPRPPGSRSIALALTAAAILVVAAVGPAPGKERDTAQTDAERNPHQSSALQKRVSLLATSQPLGMVFGTLSRRAGVRLTADPGIADQRVTIVARDRPVSEIMRAVLNVLSHSFPAPQGYHWEQLPTGGGETSYRLWRDAASIAAEKAALDWPRTQTIRYLRELRRIASESPEEQERYAGDLPRDYLTEPALQPFRDALRSLTDAQLNQLIQTGEAPVDQRLFAAGIAAFNEEWRANAQRRRDAALKDGLPDPYPNGVPAQPPDPPSLQLHVDDYGGDHPERLSQFGLYLQGVSLVSGGSMHLVFDPLEDVSAPPLEPAEGEQTIDLAPQLLNRAVSDEQRGSIGFVLQAWAKASGADIYEEDFYKPVYWGMRSRGPRMLRGTPTQILNQICKQWGYQAVRSGNSILLWSKRWAQDRAADVPERTIRAWRSRAQRSGFSLQDRIEMASALSWPQLRLTLDRALPESGPWDTRRKASVLRFLGSLTASEQASLLAGKSVPLARISMRARSLLAEAALAGMGSDLSKRIAEGSLRVSEHRAADGAAFDRVVVEIVDARASPLWSTSLLFHSHVPSVTSSAP